jgi:hypothetical protein
MGDICGMSWRPKSPEQLAALPSDMWAVIEAIVRHCEVRIAWPKAELQGLRKTPQNFPEGIAVAMPLRAEGMSRWKSFWYGQLSAAVEPVAAVICAAAVVMAAPILPYALSFAAGAMIYVVVEELIPKAHREGNVDLTTVSLMLGFAVMMVLDVALG